MKKVCLVLVAMLLLTLMPCVSFGEEAVVADSPNFILDDFSSGKITTPLTGKETTATWVKDGVGHAEGAAHLSTKVDYGSLSYPFGARKDHVYDISVWIKMDETPLIDQVQFVIYNMNAETPKTGTDLYSMVTVKKTGLKKDTWVKVSATYTCDGTGKKIGVGLFPTLPVGFLQIRIGDGKVANVTSSGVLSYTLDDLCVIPRAYETPILTEDNLLQNADFEAENYMESWYPSGNDGAQITKIAGANGTKSAANIAVQKKWGSLFQNNVDLRFGRKYQVSFWAKATSEEAVGLPIEFILSRTSGKVDMSIPNYEYVKDRDDASLSTEWKFFEMTYSNNMRTDDTIKPIFFFRVGEGTEVLSYAVDEVEIHEIPSTGHLLSVGSFSGLLSYGAISGYLATSNGLAQACLARVLEPFQNDYAILKSGLKVFNDIQIPAYVGIDCEQLKFVAQSVDYEGNVGPVYSGVFDKPEILTISSAEFNETVWNDEIPSLTATVSYRAEKKCNNLFATVAYYAENGQLLATYGKPVDISESGYGEKTVSVPNHKDATKAKLFFWDNTNASPVQMAAETEKVKNGRFIYIDPVAGSNNVNGGYNKPLKSLFHARSLLKREIKTATQDIYLIFMPGEYPITKTETISSAEYKDDINVIYTSYYKKDKAEFTGGTDISGTFSLYDSGKNIYRAKVTEGTQSRQLFVNGVRAVKAKSNGPLSNAVNIKTDSEGKVLSSAEVTQIKDAGGTVIDVGIQTSDTFLKDYARVDDIELVFYEKWTNPRCQVASITDNGNGTILLRMDAVGWKAMSNKGGTATTVPVYIENALELLDEEGEWYLDSVEGYVYYKPRFFENITTAEVVLPTTEKLFVLAGASADTPIKNIRFDHVEFTETTWMRPSTENGHSDAQNNHIRQNGDRLTDAAIEVMHAHDVDFTNCDFNRLGITGLKMTGAIRDCDVVGNEFYEIAGSALNLGEVTGTNVVNPKDEKYFIINNNISNNYIHNFGMEYKSAAGLSAGFPKNTNISHNEIYCGAYSGMHIGYGWESHDKTGTATENLHITQNYIHNVLNDNLYDGGGIYTIGMTGGTRENPNLISENYFEDIANMHGAIYPDQGSAFWKISKNVVDLSMNKVWTGKLGTSSAPPYWLHLWTSSIHDIMLDNNYSTTLNYRNAGTNIDFEQAILPNPDGWQPEAEAVIENAGIQKEFQQNFKYGFQRLETAEKADLKVGDVVVNIPVCFTGKEQIYPTHQLEMYVKSSNPSVATATDSAISAHSAGDAVITYYVIEQGILKTASVNVTVTK